MVVMQYDRYAPWCGWTKWQQAAREMTRLDETQKNKLNLGGKSF